jgi:hypothetical protein
MKKLPIGIQTFSKIIEEDYLYIDKTKEAFDLIDNYKYVFLSRPRRFGKSLFLDTLQEIFSGNKELFKGLYIYDKYKFEKYPVIKISWAGDFKTLSSTKQRAQEILENNQKRLGVICKRDNPSGYFEELIQETYKKYNKPVVVLIDEYDKPILDNLEDFQRANENRDFLRGLYIQLKENDRFLKFVFLTGITKFAKASIFSGLNNIEDISLSQEFGNICGYTQENIENEFKQYLKNTDLLKVKTWYNGYNFLKDKLYNPFDILKFIRNNFIFKNYWWESGGAYSLIALLKNKTFYLPKLQNLRTNDTLLNSFDIENIQIESLLFQAGYLTIERVNIDEDFDLIEYVLKVPNKEVQISLNQLFINYFTNTNTDNTKEVLFSLKEAKLQNFKEILISLFASIPYNNYVKNNIAHFEGYYASVMYAYLASLGLELIAEDTTNTARIDLTLKFKDKIYIIEFKMKDNTNALQQIKQKNYHQKYLKENKEIYLIGISFDEEKRNIEKFEWEKQ